MLLLCLSRFETPYIITLRAFGTPDVAAHAVGYARAKVAASLPGPGKAE